MPGTTVRNPSVGSSSSRLLPTPVHGGWPDGTRPADSSAGTLSPGSSTRDISRVLLSKPAADRESHRRLFPDTSKPHPARAKQLESLPGEWPSETHFRH